MNDIKYSLFSESAIREINRLKKSEISNYTIVEKKSWEKRWNKIKQYANDWNKKLIDQNSIFERERSVYPEFMRIVLCGILEYDSDLIEHERTVGDTNKPVEWQLSDKKGNRILCVECKIRGTNLKDPQKNYPNQVTPIEQTHGYLSKSDLRYGICTDYSKFILLTESGSHKYYEFDFTDIFHDEIINEELLMTFYLIFGKYVIFNEKKMSILHEKSLLAEKELTDNFYKIFSKTRLMIIKEFRESSIGDDDILKFATIFLNRLMFILFADAKGFIPTQLLQTQIRNMINAGITNDTKMVFDRILTLFKAFSTGSKEYGGSIHKFNGGLFDYDEIPNELRFMDKRDESFFDKIIAHNEKPKYEKSKIDEIIESNPNLNPIIQNILKISSYDFNSEINVNILGHIFEQSIGELAVIRNEMFESGKSNVLRYEKIIQSTTDDIARKKHGIFYTPDNITEFICKHTIIPYLSINNTATTVPELITEYVENSSLMVLKKKLRELKIIDPACGSGAFLTKSVDILLSIHHKIWLLESDAYIADKPNVKKSRTFSNKKPRNETQVTLKKFSAQVKMAEIIQNNIYGVDLNPESVEITKLALFLKTASDVKPLPKISDQIKTGNSLSFSTLDDADTDNMNEQPVEQFDWKKNFPTIFDNGGFDIVIGNPPYYDLGKNDPLKYTPYYEELNVGKKINIAALFVRKMFDLSIVNGYVGVIIPKSFLTVPSWEKIRNFVLGKNIQFINDVGKQWQEVGIEQTVVISNNKEPSNTDIKIYHEPHSSHMLKQPNSKSIILTWATNQDIAMFKRIRDNCIFFKDICEYPRGKSIKNIEFHDWDDVLILGGSNVGQFLIKDGSKRKPNRYLSNDQATNFFQNKNNYPKGRVICQNIVSSVPKFVAAIDLDGQYTDDTINNIIIKKNDKFPNNHTSNSYLMALLNSDLITYYLRYAMINNAALTVHVDSYINELPLKIPSTSQLASISKSADLITNKINERQEIINNFIDVELKNIPISKTLKQSLIDQKNRKLEKFWNFKNVDEFMYTFREIHIKFKTSIDAKNLENKFKTAKNKIKKIDNIIEENRESINLTIFDIYEITDKERERIKTILS
ncbi:MAG: Eco57I restriction-modification methylase domain-containing protein [Hyphomicrobiaceae bacterium]|nr:Eco57I restriction-modification methylase domain-containing protein [Hyphomicrobiaceae bacterium]